MSHVLVARYYTPIHVSPSLYDIVQIHSTYVRIASIGTQTFLCTGTVLVRTRNIGFTGYTRMVWNGVAGVIMESWSMYKTQMQQQVKYI